jgi:CheY-like chemotaxis protein
MAKRRLRVLLAEKRLSETGIILRSICADVGWALEMVFVGSREAIHEALRAYHPDLALLDLALLQPDAVLCIRGLHLRNNQTPLIVFGEPAEKACAEACLSSGARDYLLEGFMDERTVSRVLQAAVAAMEEKESQNRECSKAGEACRCSLQVQAAERMTHQRITAIPVERQEQLVRILKRSVRVSDRIVPRRCGRIELVLSNASEDCLETVAHRLQTQMKASKAGLFPDARFPITVLAGPGAEVSESVMCGGPVEFRLEIGEQA